MNTLAKTPHRTYPNIASSAGTTATRADACKRIRARDGRELVLRQIRADDVAALQRGFAHLSSEEVRMRFLHPLAELPLVLAESLCDLDPSQAVAWVLADPDEVAEPEIHAVARAHVDLVTEQAEFAVVVQQRLCGQGFGTLLTRLVIEDARRLGAVEIWGDILLDNAAMQGLCDSFGFQRHMVPHHPGVQRATLAM
jgi:RimJ/RimL family protein N-acetyltransferase